MSILNLLQTIGMMSRIQISEYDECLRKSFHKERKQKWMDYIASKRNDEEDVADIDKTELEKRGIVDIPAMLKRRNTNQSVEDRMNRLYDYLLDEQYVIMNCKSEEEREKGGVKRQTHSMQEEEASYLCTLIQFTLDDIHQMSSVLYSLEFHLKLKFTEAEGERFS